MAEASPRRYKIIPAMMEDIFDKLALCGKAGVIPVVDIVSADLVSPVVGTLPLAASLVITSVRKKLMPNATVLSDPHSDIRMLPIGRSLHDVWVWGLIIWVDSVCGVATVMALTIAVVASVQEMFGAMCLAFFLSVLQGDVVVIH